MGWLGKRSGAAAATPPRASRPGPVAAITTTVPTCIKSPHACATPRSGVPGTCRAPGLAAQLPEELGDLHQPGRRDRVADAEQSAGRQHGRSPSRAVTPSRAASGAFPLSKSSSPSRWCSSL